MEPPGTKKRMVMRGNAFAAEFDGEPADDEDENKNSRKRAGSVSGCQRFPIPKRSQGDLARHVATSGILYLGVIMPFPNFAHRNSDRTSGWRIRLPRLYRTTRSWPKKSTEFERGKRPIDNYRRRTSSMLKSG